MTILPLQYPDLIRSQCLVNGAWIGVAQTAVINPARGHIIEHVPHFGAAETTDAVLAAKNAFPLWAKRTAQERSRILARWYELMITHADDLARIMTAEQGKPLSEARGEVLYAADYIQFYAHEAIRVYGETLPSPRFDARGVVMRQPVGVIGAITPWNFPAAMMTRKIAPALAVGCTAVIKPAAETPLTALAIGFLGQEAGLPNGVLNIITGDAQAIGEVLTTHPDVRAFSFTGSTSVGKQLMRQCAGTVKKVALELGGHAPLIVFADADLDAAVEGAMQSKFRNMGQTCVCANRIFVERPILEAFTSKFVERVKALRIGAGDEPDVDQGPLISDKAIAKIEAHIKDALDQGAHCLIGGKRHKLGGTYFEPTVLSHVTPDMIIFTEETFGPVAPIIAFDTEDEVIALANRSDYGLSAYLFTRDLGRTYRVMEALEYGMVGVNTGIISSVLAPFGGVKQSGLGREGSHHGLDEYLETKYVLIAGVNELGSK
jgi:succinate-semialdehyde dehydrogenase/glutarate-semialdehyde dehydrogenase